jgi:hypothetical protein
MRFACFAWLDHRHAESHHCSNHCKEREIFLFFPHISSSLGFARSAIASQNNSNRRRLILPVQKHERRHRRRRKTSVSCAPCFVSMMPQEKNFDASFDVDVAREQHRTRWRPSRFSAAGSMAAFDGCHEPPPDQIADPQLLTVNFVSRHLVQIATPATHIFPKFVFVAYTVAVPFQELL